MRKYFDSIAESITNKIKGSLVLEVFAEDNNNNQNSTEPQQQNTDNKVADNKSTQSQPQTTSNTFSINFEDLISKARQEEKAKLYPQIESLKEKVNELTEKNNQNLLVIEEKDRKIKELEKEIEKLKNSKVESESETVKRLQAENDELRKKLEEAEKNKVDKAELEKAIRAEVEQEYEVKLYRLEKINSPEYRDKIIPELVMGITKEEIDKTLELARQRYEEIVNSVVTRQSASIPMGNISTGALNSRQLNLDEIKNLDPRSKEYLEFRKRLGLK